VKLEAVGKRYGARQPWVVRDVTAQVHGGELIRLDGRNGTGKSTLLRVIAGVTMPSRGRITGRARVGYVPERFPSGMMFTCRGYLGHMARLHGGGNVDEWLDRMGAAAFADSSMRTLSKGMTQKVAVAQALLAGPDLLILDEAWTGLDQPARAELDAAVRERVAAGGTVFFVDHDPTRLTDDVGQHWTLDGSGPLSITTRPAPPATVLISVSGLPPATSIPGVISASGGVLRVAAADSDEVLRRLLAIEGVHVMGVR
jgi:ABC-2 type transport system ATP-binding protein